MDKSHVASMVERSENQHLVCKQNSGNENTKGVSQTATRIPIGIVSVSSTAATPTAAAASTAATLAALLAELVVLAFGGVTTLPVRCRDGVRTKKIAAVFSLLTWKEGAGKTRRDCHSETKRSQTSPTNEIWARDQPCRVKSGIWKNARHNCRQGETFQQTAEEVA